MNVNNFFRITVEFSSPTGSDPLINVWDYRVLSTDNPIILTLHGLEIVESFVTRYYTPLSSTISTQTPITSVSIRAWTTPEDGFDSLTGFDVGSATAALMPPANTLAFRLVRTNFAMRNGRKAMPGATAVSLASNGGVTPATVSLFSTVTDAWAGTDWVPEISGVDAVFGDVIIRVPTIPNTDPTVFSTNITYGIVYWGTQNSRK